MTDFDPIAFGKEMGAYVQDELRPIREELGKVKAADSDAIADLVVAKLLASDRLSTLVDLAVNAHMAENPPPAGKDADPVKSEDIAQAVAKHLEANPPPAGADGVGLAGAMIDRAGSLKVTTTKGEVIDLGPVQGRDGADFTECAIEYDGERTITIKGKAGEITKSVPVPLDRGYWREGMAVDKSDILTHDGNAWIALRDTKAKPCHENKEDWRLFARRGRDGKDGQKVFVERQPVSLGE